MVVNLSESLLAKLKNAAKAHKISMPMAMRRYAYERMLQVMADCGMDKDFCLKGGVLMGAMFQGRVLRPTEDLDLHGIKDGLSISHMEASLRRICATHTGDDGLVFDVSSLKIVKNRDGERTKGGKIHMTAFIGNARVPLKIDVGYGSPVTPGMQLIELPTLIPSLIAKFPFPAYPLETVISEKLHAMHRHGLANTRQKDYFDIYNIANDYEMSGSVLAEAFLQTFFLEPENMPSNIPALSDQFALQRTQEAQWQAFLRETHYPEPLSFVEAVSGCRNLIIPVLNSFHGEELPDLWLPQEGWQAPAMVIGR